MLAIHLANVHEKPDQLILIHFDFFTYKYPPNLALFISFPPILVSKSLNETERVFWRSFEQKEGTLMVFHLQEREPP
jgi:hypothetical protein